MKQAWHKYGTWNELVAAVKIVEKSQKKCNEIQIRNLKWISCPAAQLAAFKDSLAALRAFLPVYFVIAPIAFVFGAADIM